MALGTAFAYVMSAAQANAPWAFERLYREFAAPVAGYLRAQGALDPDDLVSDTFVGAFSGIAGFEGGEAQFRSWLFTIAHRRIVDHWRRARRQPPVTDQDASNVAGGNVEDDALGLLGTERVHRLLAGLTPDQRNVLLLRIVADLTVEQVAKTLGKSIGAVKALQRRALVTLQKEISRQGVPV